MRYRDTRTRPSLFLTGLVALLSLLSLGGGVATVARAGVPGNAGTGESAALPTKILVLQVYFRSQEERDSIATQFGAEEVPTTNGYLTIIGDIDTLNHLKARGLRVEIDERNTNALNNPGDWETFYGGYKTVEELYAFMDQKVSQFPTLAAKVDIGDSWCKSHPGSCIHPEPNNGYDLFVMQITNQAIPGPKPVVWIDAGIHSREIAPPEVAIRYIDWLLNGYATNADARWLVDWHDIWVMPTFNPDGHHIVESGGGGNSPYLYRKNGNNTAGTCSWPPTSSNHFGVDDNRNFPFKWGCCGGSTTAPCQQTYRGTAEASEDETQAVVAKLRQLIPDQRGPGDNDAAPITTTGVYQNIHTVVPVNLIPWGWSTNLAPNYADLNNIAAHSSALNAYPSGNEYPYGPISTELYIVDGGSIDWAYGERGIASISTELSGDSFLPPYSCIDNPGCDSTRGIWPENQGMLIYLAKVARQPYLITRGPDAKDVATSAMTVTQGTMVPLTATINYNWTGNAYLQNVAAAEYYINTPPWAGGTGTAMTAVDGGFNSATEAVGATINTASLPVGQHVVFVRGRGVNDYEGHQSWGPFTAVYLTVQPGGGTPTVAPPTSTSVPPSATSVPPTATSVPATATQPAATATTAATATPCLITFTDVPPDHVFYSDIRCLACRGILGGYSDGTFRPGNSITRGQASKVVSNAAGLTGTPSGQTYTDVPPSHTFYLWIERLTAIDVISGYPCGSPGEPCDSENRPYFRPQNNLTRGQLSKIVSETAGITTTPSGQTYTDVPPTSTFYLWIERLTNLGVMGGYQCGGPGEPCDSENRPYFRPNNEVTRGQASKIVANTFLPDCVTP